MGKRSVISPAEFYALRDMRRAGVKPRDLALATERRQNTVSRLTRRVTIPSPKPAAVSSSLGTGLYPTMPILLPGMSDPLPAAHGPMQASSQMRRRSFHSEAEMAVVSHSGSQLAGSHDADVTADLAGVTT